MENILTDENGDYGLEYTNAVWASDRMHQDYHDSKVPLSDADFLLEDTTSIMVIEYKNANTRKARDAGFKTLPFELQKKINTGGMLIDKVDVLSLEEWNKHDEYGKYPFVKIEQRK